MSDNEFVRAVANLRWAQKGYFTSPAGNVKQEYLKRSKVLESQVDKELKVRGYDVDAARKGVTHA